MEDSQHNLPCQSCSPYFTKVLQCNHYPGWLFALSLCLACSCRRNSSLMAWRAAVNNATSTPSGGSIVSLRIFLDPVVNARTPHKRPVLKLEFAADNVACRQAVAGSAMLDSRTVYRTWETSRPVLKYTNLNIPYGTEATLTIELTSQCTPALNAGTPIVRGHKQCWGIQGGGAYLSALGVQFSPSLLALFAWSWTSCVVVWASAPMLHSTLLARRASAQLVVSPQSRPTRRILPLACRPVAALNDKCVDMRSSIWVHHMYDE
ncbi:pherophorin, partial [Haematococcus lacustris]